MLRVMFDLIGSFPEFACVRTCASGEEALRLVPPAHPDIILMDTCGMPTRSCTSARGPRR